MPAVTFMEVGIRHRIASSRIAYSVTDLNFQCQTFEIYINISETVSVRAKMRIVNVMDFDVCHRNA